jgi:3-methyladenine DNA glycosylase AlkD
MTTQAEKIISQLKGLANPDNVAGMARYGINTQGTLGVSIYALRPMAKEIGTNHELALELWDAGIHEGRILAAFIDDPSQVTQEQMESWVDEFDSWDVCDQVCSSLFDRTPFAYEKAFEWSNREQEFVVRAGFVLMAALAVHDKKASDETLAAFFPVIISKSIDERNFVKKAVNWALRNLGKRNRSLNAKAIETANCIYQLDSRSARWIARDAIRELSSEKIQNRLKG